MPRFGSLLPIVILILSRTVDATDYFISPQGDDGNSGTSRSRAWKSIDKVNSWDFKPGDRVLFQGGQSFAGNLVFTAADAGTSARPVAVSSYGMGRATIRAGNGTGILVENAGGFSISNLVVVSEDRTSNKGNGVSVVNRLRGGVKLSHVRIDGVDAAGFGLCGILVGGEPLDAGKSGFVDVRITRCKVHDNAYYGIHVTGASDPALQGNANREVYVGYCKAYDNPGDPAYQENHSGSGIMIEEVDGGTIEQCVAFNNGYLCNFPGGGPCGIWTHASNRVTIQHNESFNNRTGRSVDGCGFDFDGGVSNSLLQYNYSHGNDGAGYLLYTYNGAPHTFRDNVVRFNISEDDGRKNTYAGIYVGNDGSGVSNLEIHNNTIYITPSVGDAKPRAVLVRGTT
ncbi:MAG TPA: right-handed parallel beta-helix repeat-containing protein, partial [Acidobacteriota bacterium]|nr:right-handed parallel beta-helix repeat-containing protein [Acidobacteriota bacterium]